MTPIELSITTGATHPFVELEYRNRNVYLCNTRETVLS